MSENKSVKVNKRGYILLTVLFIVIGINVVALLQTDFTPQQDIKYRTADTTDMVKKQDKRGNQAADNP
jgi:hypothetical protein